MERRILIALLCAAVLMAGLTGAFAEPLVVGRVRAAVENAAEANDRVELRGQVWFEENCDVLGWRASEDDDWRLVGIDGKPIDDTPYTRLDYVYYSSNFDHGYFIKAYADNGDPLGCCGILGAAGETIVPTKYALAGMASERWGYGVNVAEAADGKPIYAAYDEASGVKKHYVADSVDFYLRGEYVGTLSGSAFGCGNAEAFGDYLALEQFDGTWHYYDRNLKKSPFEGSRYAEEYDSDYVNGGYVYTHTGTGQLAFTPGCTLTVDEVECAIQSDYDGNVFDLQGNVLFNCGDQYHYLSDFMDGYAKGSAGDTYGMVDVNGREIIPPVYDYLDDYERTLRYGYIRAEKDGRFGYLNDRGEVTCDFIYPAAGNYSAGLFSQIENLDGSFTILTAAVGELPEAYKNAYPYDMINALTAQNMDGAWSVIDLYGNELLSGIEAKSLRVNADVTFALAYLDDEQYAVFTIRPANASEGESGVADEGTWTCENGHTGNTGNFCGECGAVRPTGEAPRSACASCGYDFGGNTPKFCPNCGTPQQ